MDVIAYAPVVAVERAELFNVALVSLHELLERADFVTLHVPLVDSNRNLLGAAELALMKPTARLVNTARGGIVDETALCAALQSGRLAAAAADVFEQEPPGENPLLALPNFVATPHIGASTAEAQVSVAFDVAEEVAAVLAGDLPRFAVNAPALPPEELAYLRPFAELTERLAALHAQLFEGRGGVVGRVGSILGEHDVNIASMQVGRDAPRGNAMMILAVDDRVAPEVLSRLREVGGMSDLRYVELGTGSDG